MYTRSRYSNSDTDDVHFVYGFSNGDARAAAREYHRRTPNCRVLINSHRRICEYGIPTLPIDLRPHTCDEKLLLVEIYRDLTTSTIRITHRLVLKKSIVWRPFHFCRVQDLYEGDSAPLTFFVDSSESERGTELSKENFVDRQNTM
ncbi:hypothetical protein EVAR_83595_1 [Eumeta japonica]|uniref:DUF4817 domain-containing protein n=1 Tax=Eumeta variegata TaxID=151549 RepID=A0A4C1UNG0_EUMVA|nr:hypothetical protein EVAR_83595_1 [Eumeta japonica]